MFHHPRYSGWRSDAVDAGSVRFGERRFIAAYLASHMGRRHRRFVEKTPENSLRVPYLLDLFPDASFVVVQRNPADVVHSLIRGWRDPAGRFRSYFVPQELAIRDYPHRRRWCFALVEGWRRLASSTLEECAFEQWRQCSEALAEARSQVDPARWREIHLETLLEHPEETFVPVAEALGIVPTEAVMARLREGVAHPVNASSPAGRNKWRRDDSAEVRRLLPRLSTLAGLAGYALDPDSGDFEIVPRMTARR